MAKSEGNHPLPRITYQRDLADPDVPYQVKINRIRAAELLRAHGVTDEEIAAHSIHVKKEMPTKKKNPRT